jgi:eukaryotic-like serine/threonine-protein kinase
LLLPDEAFASVDAELTVSEIVGDYRLEAKLGEGGFGSVYRGVHTLIGKVAAVKVLHRTFSSNPQIVSRFIDEARAVNQIRHKNIIDIFAFGRIDDGRHYFVMELCEGESLEDQLARVGRLSLEAALPVLRAIARALGAAHAAGIAHRDLKPDNVYLAQDQDGEVVPKLLDFGIAKLFAETAPGHKTKTGSPIGTPQYMSPEQCRGVAVDLRTDVYSFGALIYRVLTGQQVFDANTTLDLMVMHIQNEPPYPSKVCADLLPDLDAPIRAMLAKDPSARPESAEAALDALVAAGAAAGMALPPSLAKPSRSGARTSLAKSESTRVIGSGKSSAPTPTFVEADTLIGSEPGKTLVGSETDVTRPVRKLSKLAALAGLVALLLGATTLAFLFWQNKLPKPVVASASPSPSVTAQPIASAEIAASTTAPASVSAAPTAVEITITGAPPTAEIFLGKQRLGKASEPIKLAPAKESVKLTLVVAGFDPTPLEITPDASKTVAAPPLRPLRRHEYENPYQ